MSQNRNILFVDDEDSIRDAYKTILAPSQQRSSRRMARTGGGSEKPEYNLFFAESGERAVEIFKEQLAKGDPIGMGFFDMIMPGGIDGAETIKQIRQIDSRITCVIVTAYADRDPKEIREFFDDQSMWLYLNKPFNDGEIKQLAANMMRSWNLRREVEDYSTHMESLVKQRTEQLNAELEKVAIVQRDLLPHRLPKHPNLEVSAYYQTCVDLGGGGDYYDLIELPDNKLGIAVADASGHGPSAACIMAITRAMFRDVAKTGSSPGTVLEQVNDKVEGNYPRGNFVTIFYGILDLLTGEMVSANSAHPFPVYGKKGKFEVMEGPTGMILGMFNGGKYEEARHKLQPGDHLLVFTDGLEEHKNAEREEFGYERILATCAEYGDLPPQQFIENIVKTADAFRPDLPREDDFTFVNIRWTPQS
ncbi:MAG: fused response regulator/phosphatase [SAR324 cluster bacterium]|nr:fused response regulator/phosphatase [SAR324 cluster bacterium]